MPIQFDWALLRAQPKYSISAVMIVRGVPTVVITDNAERRVVTASDASVAGGVGDDAVPTRMRCDFVVTLRVFAPTRSAAAERPCDPPDAFSDGMAASYSASRRITGLPLTLRWPIRG